MASFGQSIALTIFLALLMKSVNGVIMICRYITGDVFSCSCPPAWKRWTSFWDIYSKMAGNSMTSIKYTLSSFCGSFDVYRTGENGGHILRRDNPEDHIPGRCLVLLAAVAAIAIIWAQIFGGAAVINILIETPVIEETSLVDMDLIKFGEGRPIKKFDECTLNGILYDDETGLEGNAVNRQDVRLDSIGVYDLTDPSSIIVPYYVWAVLTEDHQTKEVTLMLDNFAGFAAGISMRASVTGVDGIARSYFMHDGSFENNPKISSRLEMVAETLGVELLSPVNFIFGKYHALLNATFSDLEHIVNTVSNIYCDLFSIAKIDRSEHTRVTIPTTQTTIQTFPTWFWIVFAILCCIALIDSFFAVVQFDDTEKLVILSKDIKGRQFSLAAPVTDLDEIIQFGYSKSVPEDAGDQEPIELHYGHLYRPDEPPTTAATFWRREQVHIIPSKTYAVEGRIVPRDVPEHGGNPDDANKTP